MQDLFGIDNTFTEQGSLAVSMELAKLPLAARLRPKSLAELVGQEHLLAAGSPLRRMVSGETAMSVFLWGPPGVGKTTIAAIIAQGSNRRFIEISAVSAGVKELRQEIKAAKAALVRGVETILFIDEVHRFSKAQQDVLLPSVENRFISLVAATTENPSFSVISPLLSRSLLVTLKPLSRANLETLIQRALTDERGLALLQAKSEKVKNFVIAPAARELLIDLANGDARRLLTYLEEAAIGALANGSYAIEIADIELAIDQAAPRYDKQGDQHYDVVSAFIKSIRGSDVQAALHYLARMITAGEDPRFIARRLIILASEDIGLAAPSVLQTAVAAAQAVEFVGLPEARLNLAQAVIAASLAPKSNAVIAAIDAALADVNRGNIGEVPLHLRDAHYSLAKDLGHGLGYQYPHHDPNGVVAGTYLPAPLAGRKYYLPSQHGNEENLAQRLQLIDSLLQQRKD